MKGWSGPTAPGTMASWHRCRRTSSRRPETGRAIPLLFSLTRFSEMLPGPECWLEQDGERYTSELRCTAVDLTNRKSPA